MPTRVVFINAVTRGPELFASFVGKINDIVVFFVLFFFNFTEWKFRITVEQTLVESSEFHFPIKEITMPSIYHYCESINLHHVHSSALPRHFIHDAAEFAARFHLK